MSGGFLASKLGEDSYVRICQVSSLLPVPLMLVALFSSNFFLSIGCVSLTYLVSNLWLSPNMTMMQRAIPPSQFGGVISAFQFLATMAGCLGTFAIGSLVNQFPLQNVIAVLVTTGYLGSIFAWS